LEGLRSLAGHYGFVLVFDEVKTGFRHALGGYSALQSVKPDFAVYGKAVANGYPIAILGGKREYMDYFVHPDAAKRVLLAGTYNAHPVPVAASLATIRKLLDGAVYRHVERLGARMEAGLRKIAPRVAVSRIGSAFCLYFMDHVPVDWHDLAANHDAESDNRLRRRLIESGVYVFPLAAKQWSISAAHTEADIDETLAAIERALA